MSQYDAPSEVRPGGSVYERLLSELHEGRLQPGMRLLETELAERLGVSRTPVREAIRQLEADGLVTHVPRQGAAIRTLDYAELMELYEMRAVLEGTAARLAARGASDIEIEELFAINEALALAGPTREAWALNRQFHQGVLDAAKNRFLRRSTQGLQKALMILGPTTLLQPERAASAVAEHQAVLEAIKARDGAAAEAAMRQHIESAQRVRVRALRAQPQPDDLGF
ncbi:MAG: GntR family transcriptional regulator [Pseudomonadota bacterium]|nr:GntR family transcriptional regulator [Pseudomonadota bacterium]MEE3071331.1 GntR family transcriptional regulator [Pseudomonadota bacterium]